MKKISFLLMILMIISCNNDFEILSSKKQRIIPGIQTEKPYTNYFFEINVKVDADISIENVLVFENNKCFETKPLVTKKGASSYSNEIGTAGVYFLEVRLNEGNFAVLNNCNENKSKVIINYNLNNKSKTITITSFIEEDVRRR